MTFNIPETRLTFAASVSVSWRGVIGVILSEPERWLFCLALGYRTHAFDANGMLDHRGHRGVKGIVRFSRYQKP